MSEGHSAGSSSRRRGLKRSAATVEVLIGCVRTEGRGAPSLTDTDRTTLHTISREGRKVWGSKQRLIKISVRTQT